MDFKYYVLVYNEANCMGSYNVYLFLFQDLERIKSKASVSHKERVEKFNAYLNSLSEHYEPAKVSWTK